MAVNTTSYPSSIGGGNTMTADNTSNFGMNGFMNNMTAIADQSISAVAIGSSTTVVLTGAQFVKSVLDISGTPGGGVGMTTPTAAQIIAALPNTIPKDGTFNFEVSLLNDATGQTITLSGGSNVTVLGTNTIATNTNRTFKVSVNVNAGTVTMMNLGSVSL